MRNKRGMTVSELLERDIAYVETVKDRENRRVLTAKALGAADLAVDFGLITYNEWDRLVHRIFKIL